MRSSIYKNRKIIKFIKNKNNMYTVLSITVLIVLWKLAALGIGKEIILPSPEAVFIKIIDIIKQEYFIKIVSNTLFRTFISFILSILTALVLGILSGVFEPVFYLVKPIIDIIRSTPTMAIIILALMWLGGEKAPILIGFIVIFPILYSNVVQGIINVDSKLIEMAECYEISKNRVIREIYIPSINNYVKAGLNSALGLNFKVMIAAEVIGQPEYSMGTSLQMEKINLDMPGVFAWSIILIILAVIFDSIINVLHD